MNSTLKGYVNTCYDKEVKDYTMIILFIFELLVFFGVITAHKKYLKNRRSGNIVIHEEEEEEVNS